MDDVKFPDERGSNSQEGGKLDFIVPQVSHGTEVTPRQSEFQSFNWGLLQHTYIGSDSGCFIHENLLVEKLQGYASIKRRSDIHREGGTKSEIVT